MNVTPETKDEARLKFASGKAHQVTDLSEREAKLIDEISENAARELTPMDRHTLDRIERRFKDQRTI